MVLRCSGGAEVQRCRGAEEVVRCRGAERWLLVQGAEVQRRCRGGAEVVQRRWRGAEEQRGGCWCRGGAEVVESPGTQVVSAEVVRGAEERGSGGAEVQKW